MDISNDQVSLKLIAILYRKKLLDKAILDQAQAQYGIKQKSSWIAELSKT